MKRRIRALCLLLSALLCTSLLVACNPSETNESSVVSQTADESKVEYNYGPQDYGEFPYKDQNYKDSKPIRILAVETARHTYGEQQFVYDEEKEGNIINNAVQQRNNFLEDTYGITFEVTPAKYPNETIALLIQSNTDEYDLISESIDRLVLGVTENYYWSLDDYMNFSHPWWDAQAIETLTLGEQHYFLAGDALITDDDNTYLTLYNKDMYKTNSELAEYGDIYQIVREGKFTIDLYYEMCKKVSQPDSSGLWSFNATYGNLSHAYGATIMMNGCGIATVVKNEDDELILNVGSESAVNAFGKVYELMSDRQNTQRAELIAGQSPNNSSQYGFAELAEMFQAGRGLFYNTSSNSISNLKSANLDFEFGVLPIPKLNENQDNYCCSVNRYQSTALGIPTTVPVAEIPRIVFALQALGFYNAEVIRAYYQTTLQLQAITADDDAEMLDIVYNNRFYDIGAIFTWGSLLNLYGNVIADSNSNTLTSKWESMEGAVESAMQATIDAYKNALN